MDDKKKRVKSSSELVQMDRDKAHEARWLKSKRSSSEQSIMDASAK